MRIRTAEELGLAVAAMAIALGCTPPRTELHPVPDGHSDATVRAQETRPVGNGRYAGPASAPAGFVFFNGSQQMYAALGDLVTGAVARGSSSYELDVAGGKMSDSERAALSRVAERSARAEARSEGRRLLATRVQLKPLDDGTVLVRATSEILDANDEVHRELREGVIRGEHLEWTTPPLKIEEEPRRPGPL